MRSEPIERSSRSRRYPPLTLFAVGLLLAATALPSALNVPQSNPTQRLEYAPVPPDDDSAPPPGGNLSSLGLGRTSSLLQGANEIPPSTTAGLGRKPTGKRCVGNPPKQDADPLSPPCSAFFEGDNGGATYQGVTKSEVRILIYQEGSTSQDAPAWSRCGVITDLGNPGPETDYRYLRAWQRYFNDRYQTYNRFVRFFVQRSNCQQTPEARRADATRGFEVVDPFAVFFIGIANRFGNTLAYLETLLDRGVVGFMAPTRVPNKPQAMYTRHAGRLFSYGPTIEHQAALYIEYICKKVVPFPVSFSGNALDQGKPRKLGQLYGDDNDVPEIRYFSEMVKQGVENCGGKIAVTRTMPSFNPTNEVDQDPADTSRRVAENMATFKSEGVTTILWTGMIDILHSQAAARIEYRPEWVAAAMIGEDTNEVGALSEPSVWEHAWVISQAPYMDDYTREVCYMSAQEADPGTPILRSQCSWTYPAVRHLFIGIQVAGPRLNPRTLDQGFHAIPKIASTHPKVPACFLDGPSDYTCVKDAIPEWWDPRGPRSAQFNQPGCWRIPEQGRRFLSGTWPRENVDEKKRPGQDLCNNYY